MFLRNLHERIPVRFLDDRSIWLIGGFLQLEWGGDLNQVELKLETELKALVISCRSVVLHDDNGVDNDSAKANSEMMLMRTNTSLK